MLSDEQRVFYDENGYVQLQGLISAEACDRLINDIWSQIPARMRRDDPHTWQGRIQDCCNNLPIYQRKGLLRFKDKYGFRNDPAVSEEIYGNPRLREAFSVLLGLPLHRIWVRGLHPVLPMPRRITLNEALGNRFEPGSAVAGLSSFRIPRPPQIPIAPHLDVHAMDAGAILYLNDIEEVGGAFGVWPGSHRLMRLGFNSEIEWTPTPFYKRAYNLLRCYRPKLLAGKRGDVVIFHNRLMHTNTTNRTGTIRHAILIDALGENWKERNNGISADLAEERKRLIGVKNIRNLPLAQEVTAGYRKDPVSTFLTKHPRVGGFLHRIGQDPEGKQRRSISRKVRARKEGETWIVVSPAGEWQDSPKIDAYGDRKGAKFKVELNGRPAGRSQEGIFIEKLDAKPGRNRLRISGKTKNKLYIRVVGTKNPIHTSPVFMKASIEPGERELKAEFSVPFEAIPDVSFETRAGTPPDGTAARIDRLYDLGVANNKIATPLPDGSYYPAHLSAPDDRPLEFIEQFNRVRDKPWKDCTFLDLGCSEGAASFTISQTGARVKGIDGRPDAIFRARALADILGYADTGFEVGNVCDSTAFSDADGIFAASIINHLEDPLSFLQLCCKHARSFVYIDAAHMPRNPGELENSRFRAIFGDRHTLSLDGLEINSIEFAEPKEIREHGISRRRHPRSGIGNTQSLLLSHDDLIAAMAKLGFPHHETLAVVPSTPRMRTAFYRSEPRGHVPVRTFAHPLPLSPEPFSALCIAAKRDLARLLKVGTNIILLGDEPRLSEAAAWLHDHGLTIGQTVALPEGREKPIPLPLLQSALDNAEGHLVLAGYGINDLYEKCMLLDRFDQIYGGLSGLFAFGKAK